MFRLEHADGPIRRIVLAGGRERVVVLGFAVVDSALDGEPVVRRAGVVDVVVCPGRGAVKTGQNGPRRARGDAQAGIAVPAVLRLGAEPVVDDVHAANLAVAVDIQIVVLHVAVLFDIEVGGSVCIGGIRSACNDLQPAVRRIRGIDAVARDGVKTVRLQIFDREVIQLARRADGAARRGDRRTHEVDAVVGVRLQRVGVAPDGAVVLRDVVIELGLVVVDGNAVQHDLTEVDVGRLAIVLLVQVLLIPGVLVGRLGRVGADAVDLIVLIRLRIGAVLPVRDVHRVVDVGVGDVLAVDRVRRGALGKGDARPGSRVVGDEVVVLLIHDVDGAVHLDKAVERGVVGNAEVELHIRTVKRGASEVEIGVVHLTRGVAHVVGRRIVDALAVDIDAGGIVRRDHERGNDRLCLIDARLDIGHPCAHQSALDGSAVGVVRGVRLNAVDEVDVVPLLHDETALRCDRVTRRGALRKGRKLISARRHGRRGCRQQRAGGENTEFSEDFTHGNNPSILREFPF